MRYVVLLIFFGSGFAALLYQVVWQRMLATFSGTDVFSVTIIVAAFMAGLGVGNLAGGQIGDRLSRRANVALFAGAELAIGVFGLLSRWLYYDLLYLEFGHLATNSALLAVILFVSLLWPTFFMGLSLPLLARGLTRDVTSAARVVGSLYGWNTLGAAAGALTATWCLLPQLGLDGSLIVGAIINLACGFLVLPLALLQRREASAGAPRPTPRLAPSGVDQACGIPFVAWCLVYGLSGGIALSLEIVWFRLLGVMMKATAFTFGTLLATYLAGLGLGAAVGSVTAPHSRRPARTFFVLQAGVGLCAVLVTGGLLASLGNAGAPSELFTYFGRYETLDVFAAVHSLRDSLNDLLWETPKLGTLPWPFLKLYVGLPAVMIGLPMFLSGLSFPYLQKVVHTDVDRLGRRTGTLMVANIAGSLAGTVLTGWLLLRVLGTPGTLRLAGMSSAVFLVLWAVAGRHVAFRGRVARAAAATIVVAITAFVTVPAPREMWARLHGTTPGRIIFAEDESGLSVLKKPPEGSEGDTRVFVNGVGQSWIPYGEIHTVLGALPALMHPSPRDVVVIGLGSGNTCFSAATRPETRRVTCLEIVRPQIETLRALLGTVPDRGVASVLSNPRITHVYGDGRAWLRNSGRLFDIIEADALFPESPYSGNVYSDGYFRLLLNHLNPGGLAVSWAPTDRVHDAFVSVFPHVLSVGSVVFGSNQAIVFDRSEILARLENPEVVRYYKEAGLQLRDLIGPWFDKPLRRYTPEFDRSTLKEFNTDLFPRDEYFVPQVFDWSMLRPPGSR